MRTSATAAANTANVQHAGDVKRPKLGNRGVVRPANSFMETIGRLRSMLNAGLPGTGRLPPERVLANEIGVTAHCINNQAMYAAAHRRIAAAVAERNPVLAEEAMRAHLSKVQQQLIEHAFPRPEPTT